MGSQESQIWGKPIYWVKNDFENLWKVISS